MALLKLSGGNTAFTVSMYIVGEAIGLDRAEASRIAEGLIGNNLVEIKTLSGAIGITAAAVSELGEDGSASPGALMPKLTHDPVVPSEIRQAIETVLTQIKNDIRQASLNFDDLAGLIVDVKTIEIQLTASSPKTAIIRECLKSLKSWLDKAGQNQLAGLVKTLLGN